MVKIFLSVSLLSLILVGCGSQSSGSGRSISESETDKNNISETDGNSDSTITDEDIKILKSLYVSGIAIDGYLQGATVEFLDEVTVTDENGSWNIDVSNYTEEEIENSFIYIYGGVDRSTGDEYEGVILAPVLDKNRTVIATPLTTIASTMVQENNISPEDAYLKLAKMFGISEDILQQDHLKLIESGTDKEREDAVIAIKKILAFQKSLEIMCESIGTNNMFLSLSLSFVKTLSSEDNLSMSDILKDTSYIAKNLELDDKQREKLLNASTTTTLMVDEIDRIDETQFAPSVALNPDTGEMVESSQTDFLAQIEATVKTLDLISHQCEEAISGSPDNFQEAVEDVWDGVYLLGGVEGMDSVVADGGSNSEISQELFSEDMMVEYKQAFSIFEELNISNWKIEDLVIKADELGHPVDHEVFRVEAEVILERELSIEDVAKILVELENLSNKLPAKSEDETTLLDRATSTDGILPADRTLPADGQY
jgi:hypothetical protein